MRTTGLKCNGPPRFFHPLYAHLAYEVLPSQGLDVTAPAFDTTRLSNRQEVYLCREQKSRTLLVCKFCGARPHLSKTKRRDILNREFRNLSTVCNKGFYGYPHRVVRPRAPGQLGGGSNVGSTQGWFNSCCAQQCAHRVAIFHNPKENRLEVQDAKC